MTDPISQDDIRSTDPVIDRVAPALAALGVGGAACALGSGLSAAALIVGAGALAGAIAPVLVVTLEITCDYVGTAYETTRGWIDKDWKLSKTDVLKKFKVVGLQTIGNQHELPIEVLDNGIKMVVHEGDLPDDFMFDPSHRHIVVVAQPHMEQKVQEYIDATYTVADVLPAEQDKKDEDFVVRIRQPRLLNVG